MTRQRGSAVVEFALVVPLLLLAILAVVEVGVVARTQLELINAAREGAREAASRTDPAAAVAAVKDALGPELGGRAMVSVRRPAIVGKSAVVRVVVAHRVAVPVFGGFAVDLRARASMRVER